MFAVKINCFRTANKPADLLFQIGRNINKQELLTRKLTFHECLNSCVVLVSR